MSPMRVTMNAFFGARRDRPRGFFGFFVGCRAAMPGTGSPTLVVVCWELVGPVVVPAARLLVLQT